MQTSNHCQLTVFAAAIVCILSTGCDSGRPKTIPVQGRITIDGVPAQSGRVNFYPVSGGRSSTGRILNGKYVMTTFENGDGVLLGEHKVTIKVVAKNANTVTKPQPLANDATLMEQETYIKERAEFEKEATTAKFLFPMELADRRTTTITVTIEDDGKPVSLDFDSSEFE